jgi:hypothetical protein
MGCYPLFVCQDWSQLYADLEDIGNDLVSLTLVTDPFGAYDLDYLHRCFADKVIPFKEHFVAELDHPIDKIVSAHHRRYARKALKKVTIEVCQDPGEFLADWQSLYNRLIQKHDIRGIRAFSEKAFVTQLNMPGVVVLRAVYQDTTVGMHLWFVHGEFSYGHLGAYSELGYKLDVSYALFWSAIEYLANEVRWMDLGGGAGLKSDGKDGLSLFKRGWSNGTRTAYLCGRIFDHNRYAKITQAKGISSSDYFPAYRLGEYA